jgi:hypothetical protein
MREAPEDFDFSSTTVPTQVVFVAADEPLLIYPSARAAAHDLEAIDVENGVYPTAYGPNGEHYRIGTEGREVVIERTGEANRPEELKALLLRYLRGVDRTPADTAPLGELTAEAWRIESDFWQEHDPYGERFGSKIPGWGCLAVVAGVAAVLYLLF